MSGKREFGDYQTPIDFAKKVCDYLRFEKHIQPSTILEPTCGIGNFLESSFSFNANKYYGIEINSEYCKYCEERFINKNVTIINSDVFTFNLKTLINNETNLLVIGNPPWVTNSTLSLLESKNTPKKKNLKRLKGIEAITGASNFDICEYIILQLINEFCNTDTIIAILCKMSVARNVFKELKFNKINFEYCEILEFDATKVFGISISACILLIKLSSKDFCADICNVYSFENFKSIMYSLSYVNGQLFNNFALKNNNFNGICCFEWRQGIKHDCSKIMELSEINGRLYNGKKEIVEIEADILFPLVKSSMFKKPIINTFSKYVLVTQKKIREETAYIEKIAPKTWEYLTNNIELFNKRKSCIYHNAPQFSMFGIGDYSYSQFKVGLSGFYKKPFFSLLYSSKNKPVMTDDTSYFICFDNYEMAYAAMLILNSKPVQEFLMNIAFLDAKRPYTKKVLKCLSFEKILTVVSYEELQKTEQMLNLRLYITRQMYSNFKNLVEHKKFKGENIMNFDDVINQRRSIRNYKETEPIEKREIEQMVEAALMAPSWKNSETARYYVSLSQDYIKMVMECLPQFNQRNSLNAGALVVTTFKKNIAGFDNGGQPVNEVGQGWGCYDLGLSNENFVLKAAQMGYGTLIMGIRDGEKLREIFNISQNEEVVAVIAVGKAETLPVAPKRRELSEVVKFFE